MKFKSLICSFLSIIICFSMTISVFASELSLHSSSSINVARFDESTDLQGLACESDVVTDFDISFSLTAFELTLNGNIENANFDISGSIATTNHNGNILFYSANDTTDNYKILYLSIERDVDNHIFFKNIIIDRTNYQNVIKLYMQPKNSDDFIIIEIFIERDFVNNIISSRIIPYNENRASAIHSWFIEYLTPTNGTEIMETRGSKEITYSQTYDWSGSPVKYYLGVRFVYDVPDLTINGTSTATCYMEVTRSNSIDQITGLIWDTTQSYFILRSPNVTFASMPNTVITSVTPIRVGNVNTESRVPYSIREATFTAPRNITMTLSGFYMQTSTIDLSYRITETSGVRTIETGYLSTAYNMCSIGDKYGFYVTIKDMVGAAKTDKCLVGFDFSFYFGLDISQNFTDYRSNYVTVDIG